MMERLNQNARKPRRKNAARRHVYTRRSALHFHSAPSTSGREAEKEKYLGLSITHAEVGITAEEIPVWQPGGTGAEIFLLTPEPSLEGDRQASTPEQEVQKISHQKLLV